jgi:hypothetical protein
MRELSTGRLSVLRSLSRCVVARGARWSTRALVHAADEVVPARPEGLPRDTRGDYRRRAGLAHADYVSVRRRACVPSIRAEYAPGIKRP